MSRRTAFVVAALALVGALLLLTAGAGSASGSTVSFGPLGWRGLAATLEELGSTRTLTRWPEEDEPLALDDDEVLVVAFPWSRFSDHHFRQILDFVRDGGELVLAYDGRQAGAAETRLLDVLGLDGERLDGRSSLLPWTWRREQTESTHQVAGANADRTFATVKLRYVVMPPESPATQHLVGTPEKPIVSVFPLGRGTVRLLPASAFANAFLHRTGNAGLLLEWTSEMDRGWVFDELHHGLGALPESEQEASRFLDRMTLQLLALYVAALLAFAWRFGPTWRERAPAADSHREFLIGLGELHGRLGHEAQAARRLAERWTRYAPNRFTTEEVDELKRLAARGDLLAVAHGAQQESRTARESKR